MKGKKHKVQFADDDFRKSSLSHHSKKACVLVATKQKAIGVRDSKDSGKITLQFTKREWKAFIAGVKAGEFDI